MLLLLLPVPCGILTWHLQPAVLRWQFMYLLRRACGHACRKTHMSPGGSSLVVCRQRRDDAPHTCIWKFQRGEAQGQARAEKSVEKDACTCNIADSIADGGTSHRGHRQRRPDARLDGLDSIRRGAPQSGGAGVAGGARCKSCRNLWGGRILQSSWLLPQSGQPTTSTSIANQPHLARDNHNRVVHETKSDEGDCGTRCEHHELIRRWLFHGLLLRVDVVL